MYPLHEITKTIPSAYSMSILARYTEAGVPSKAVQDGTRSVVAAFVAPQHCLNTAVMLSPWTSTLGKPNGGADPGDKFNLGAVPRMADGDLANNQLLNAVLIQGAMQHALAAGVRAPHIVAPKLSGMTTNNVSTFDPKTGIVSYSVWDTLGLDKSVPIGTSTTAIPASADPLDPYSTSLAAHMGVPTSSCPFGNGCGPVAVAEPRGYVAALPVLPGHLAFSF